MIAYHFVSLSNYQNGLKTQVARAAKCGVRMATARAVFNCHHANE